VTHEGTDQPVRYLLWLNSWRDI